MKKPETKRIEFEWHTKSRKTNAQRCWNGFFWYGDGKPATEASIIIRLSDWRRMLALARAAERAAQIPAPQEQQA